MHVPMEILSSLKARTDSGSGVRQRSGSGVESNASRFERMFEEELAKHGSQIIGERMNTYGEGKDEKSAVKKDEDNSEETLAAGVMGNLLNEVVIILEGDSKSVTNPEMRIGNYQQPFSTNTVNPDIETEAKKSDVIPFTVEKPEIEPIATVNAEATMTKPVTANVETNVENSTNATGEVMARMPEIRTQDSQNSAEHGSKQFEGNLSPLENENDKTQEVGQKEKTFSNTVEAVKDIPEEPVINETIAPPLSEGIRPEQFRATQQMAEAVQNAPVKPENLFQEMISRVEMMQNDTKSTMTIQLNPEFLGKVALEVAVDAAGLHVKIDAEDSGVRGMINGQLTALIESLESKGIAVVEVEVVYTGINYGSFQDPREGEQQQGRQQYSSKRDTSTADGVAFYTTLPDLMEYYMEAGLSSVEYRA